METIADRPAEPTAVRTDLGAIFVSLELSRSSWVVTALLPGGERMSRHTVPGGDIAGLLDRFSQLWGKAQARTGSINLTSGRRSGRLHQYPACGGRGSVGARPFLKTALSGHGLERLARLNRSGLIRPGPVVETLSGTACSGGFRRHCGALDHHAR